MIGLRFVFLSVRLLCSKREHSGEFPYHSSESIYNPLGTVHPPIFHSKFTCEKFGHVDELCVHGDVNRMIGWVGRVAHAEECEVISYFWLGNMKGRDDLVQARSLVGEQLID
jgi:hypothetical protein